MDKLNSAEKISMDLEQKRAIIDDAEKAMEREIKILHMAFPNSMIPDGMISAVEEKFLKICDSVGAPRPSSYK